MTARSSKDKLKETSERHQAILSELLKEEDNKYCVDCDAKGPRWASWNLGIFLCIRCAGIHRNLGVHISKVKSVNLDSWTPEQIAMVEEMGNSRARAVYEAYLPDGYKRPQTDSALEQFIRAKYELKKWIAKEWSPSQPKASQSYNEHSEFSADGRRRDVKSSTAKYQSASQTTAAVPSSSVSVPRVLPVASVAAAATKENARVSAPKPDPETLFTPMSQAQPKSASVDLLGGISDDSASQRAAVNGSSNAVSSVDLLSDLFGGTALQHTEATAAAQASGTALSTAGREDLFLAADGKNKSQKDSIMALYGSAPTAQAQPAYGPPGGYAVASVSSGGSVYAAGPAMATYGVPNSYGPMLPIPANGMMAGGQHTMPLMAVGGAQLGGTAMVFPGMVVSPMAQPAGNMMLNSVSAPGYYSQQQHAYAAQQHHAYLASQQLQHQMATMNMNGHASAVPPQGAAGGSVSWTGAGATSSGKTLDFNLWH